MINSILNDNNKINNNKNFLPEEKLSKWVFENPGNKRNCEIAKERILNIIEASNSYFANAVAKELDLSGLQLTTLPPCINGLTNLTKLNLLGNQITTIAANAFNGLTNLTELNLSGNKITTIAANAFNGLTNLTMLHLSNNQITTIEANAFNGLTNLTKLYLFINQITTIEANVFNGLTNLTELHLFINQIEKIEANVFNGLTNLTMLHLSNNQITTIEANVFNGLTNLTMLYLSNNQITTIAENTFNGLTNLTELHLSNNQITTIEANVFNGLTNLTELDLSNNQITTIEANVFNGLTNLTMLYLSNNQITTIEVNAFNGLTNLTKLDLSGNQITTIEANVFNGLTNLTELHLSNNQITTIEASVFNGLTNLTMLYLSNNQITTIEANVFNGLTNLTMLYLFNNQITTIEVNAFNGLTNLTELDLSDNQITTIEANEFASLNPDCIIKPDYLINKSDQILNIINNLHNNNANRQNYDTSEIKELINNFIKRINSPQYEYLDYYEDNQGDKVNIENVLNQFSNGILAFTIRDQSFFEDEAYNIEPYQNNYQLNVRYEFIEGLPINMKEAIIAESSNNDKISVEFGIVPNPDFKTLPLDEIELAMKNRLFEKIDEKMATIALVNVVIYENEIEKTEKISKDRYDNRARSLYNNADQNELFDGMFMVHQRYYDRQVVLELFLAIKNKNEDLFINTIAKIITGLPTNLGAQREVFKEVFTYLYITGKFPSNGYKIEYHHYFGRCGQMH